jgi:5-methylcytosine-specific restriction endonuclease McrA
VCGCVLLSAEINGGHKYSRNKLVAAHKINMVPCSVARVRIAANMRPRNVSSQITRQRHFCTKLHYTHMPTAQKPFTRGFVYKCNQTEDLLCVFLWHTLYSYIALCNHHTTHVMLFMDRGTMEYKLL